MVRWKIPKYIQEGNNDRILNSGINTAQWSILTDHYPRPRTANKSLVIPGNKLKYVTLTDLRFIKLPSTVDPYFSIYRHVDLQLRLVEFNMLIHFVPH